MSETKDTRQVEMHETEEKHNRTEVNASRVHADLALVPEKLFLPSNDRYMGGFDYRTTEDYYLEMIKGIDVCFDESKGELTFNGMPASRVDLTDIETKQRITELNTPLLHGLFSVIWFNLIKDIDKVSPIPTKQDEEQYYSNLSPQERMMNPVERWLNFDRWWHQNLDNYGIRVYIPSLMRYLSPNSNFDEDKFQLFLKELEKLDRIFGVKRVMVSGKERMIKSRLLVYGEYDQVTNTIKINSPYINRLVMDMFRDKSYEYKINGASYLTAPNLASLKESGNLEFTADTIASISYSIVDEDSYYYKESLNNRDKVTETNNRDKQAMLDIEKMKSPRAVQYSILKNRNGFPGFKANFEYYCEYDTFVALDEMGNQYKPDGSLVTGVYLLQKMDEKKRVEDRRAEIDAESAKASDVIDLGPMQGVGSDDNPPQIVLREKKASRSKKKKSED